MPCVHVHVHVYLRSYIEARLLYDTLLLVPAQVWWVGAIVGGILATVVYSVADLIDINVVDPPKGERAQSVQMSSN